MSLAQHVTAIEGVDRDLPGSDQESAVNKGLWRPLSFDPLAPLETAESTDHAVGPLPHAAAYKVSSAKRLFQVVFGALMCCLAAGVVFGFASLKPILIAEGVYADLCDASAVHDDGGGKRVSPPPIPCPEQDMRLNLFFIVASIVANVSALFAGYSLDHYGRRACYLAASVFIAAGCVLLGYAFAIPEFDGYVVGNVFLSLGGTFLFVPSFQLSNAFPKYSGLIVAVITGSFDASAAVLLLYQIVWEATDGAFAPNQFFFAYLAIPVVLLVGEFALMPRDAYHTTPELEHKIERAQDASRDVHDSDEDIDSQTELRRVRGARADRRLAKLDQIEDLLGSSDEREERAQKQDEVQIASGVWGVLHGLPAHRQMMTAWFVLILLLTVVQMLKMNNFISTIHSQYRYLLQSDEDAEAVSKFFGIALPVGGIITTPFIGWLLDSLSVTATIGVLTGFIALIGVFNCLPFLWAGYATVLLFVIFRPLYYSAMSDYATKVFGFATFGRLYGAITCLSGVLTLSQSGLDALVHGPLQGNPTPINIALAVGGTVVGLTLTGYVAAKAKAYREEVQQISCVPSEQMRLICEDEESYGSLQAQGCGL
ncbi:amino acid transporter [Poronia punctata]|nr:amino acid transporter [Poronia punctata]